jgi:MFS family permease
MRKISNVYCICGFAAIGKITPATSSSFTERVKRTFAHLCTGGGLFGFDIASMSGVLATEGYRRYFDDPVSFRQGGITCAMPAGSLVGALLSSFIADRFSRKYAVQFASLVWVLGSMSVLFPIEFLNRWLNSIAVYNVLVMGYLC